jgi:hypothetical protein
MQERPARQDLEGPVPSLPGHPEQPLLPAPSHPGARRPSTKRRITDPCSPCTHATGRYAPSQASNCSHWRSTSFSTCARRPALPSQPESATPPPHSAPACQPRQSSSSASGAPTHGALTRVSPTTQPDNTCRQSSRSSRTWPALRAVKPAVALFTAELRSGIDPSAANPSRPGSSAVFRATERGFAIINVTCIRILSLW